MPNISSPLGTASPLVPLVNATQLGKAAGLHIHFPNLAALNSAVVAERANIAASAAMWPDGQPISVASEPVGVRRFWSTVSQHARTVFMPGMVAPVTLPADANLVLASSGAPSSGTGANGDAALDVTGNAYYTKTSGAWSAGVSIDGGTALAGLAAHSASNSAHGIPALQSAIAANAAAIAAIPSAPALVIKDEGTTLTSSPVSLNFVGAGASAAQSGGAVTVTIPGGGSTRVVYASAYAVSDADISLGSASFGTNQVAALQTMLDLALSLVSLIVIWDVAASVGAASTTTALRVRPNTTIWAVPGCGAILRSASNVALLSNYSRSTGTITDKNITIKGGIWNGNGANQSRSTVPNGLVYGMDFVGVNGLAVEDVQIFAARTFCLHAGNITNFRFSDITMDAGVSATVNTDGLHVNGPASIGTVRDIRAFNLADDCVALNCDDTNVSDPFGPFFTRGDITDVTIDKIYLNDVEYGIRLLTGGSRLDRIVVGRVYGKTGDYWIVIDNFVDPSQLQLTGPGNVGTITIDTAEVEVTSVGGVHAGMSIDCKIDRLIIKNVTKSKFAGTYVPAMRFGPKFNCRQLRIDGFMSDDFNGGTVGANQIVFIAGAQVKQAVFDGCVFNSAATVAGYPITAEAGTTIDQLLLTNNLGKNFSGFFLSSGTVTSLHTPATNFMDSNVGSGLAFGGIAPAGIIGVPYSYDFTITGGTAPYSIALNSGSPPAGLSFSLSGSTLTLSGTPTTAATSTFVERITDSAGTPAHVDVSQSVVVTAASSTWALETGYTENSSTSVTNATIDPAAVKVAKKTAADAFGGNVQVKTRITPTTTGAVATALNAAVFLRGSNDTPWSNSGSTLYYVDLSFLSSGGTGNGFVLAKHVSGTETRFNADYIGSVSRTDAYDMTITAKIGVITVRAQRVSDGFYAQTDGSWSSTAADIFTWTDSAIAAAAGDVGVYSYLYETGQAMTFSNFSVLAAP